MRKISLFISKYGPEEGPRFYRLLQELASAGRQVQRQRQRMLRQGLPVPPAPRRCS